MRFSEPLGDFLITQTPGIVKSRCGDEILRALGDFLITQSSGIVKSRYDDENLRDPGDFLITQSSGNVKSCCGDENPPGPPEIFLVASPLNYKIPRRCTSFAFLNKKALPHNMAMPQFYSFFPNSARERPGLRSKIMPRLHSCA